MPQSANDRAHGRRKGPRAGLTRIVHGLLIAACAPFAAAPASAADSSFIVPSMPGNGFHVDVSTMLDRRYYTVTRQRYDFSCGSAALATLLRYHYGVRADEESTFNGMWDKGDQAQIRKLGFSLLDMKTYLKSLGLETAGFRVTLDQIAKTQIPGIALTVTNGYRHFVVVKGVAETSVLVGDPSRGLLRYDRKAFEKIWDGLYFVITDARDTGQRSFNRPGQWAAIGHAPIGGQFGRPLDTDSLRLTAPYIVFGEL